MLLLRNTTCITFHYPKYDIKKSKMNCKLGEIREEKKKIRDITKL
jgi:hypothetical protein